MTCFCQKKLTFVIAFPLFTSNIRGLQPQASHSEFSWMVARIWPRDIFFEKKLKIQVEHPRNVKNSKNIHFGRLARPTPNLLNPK